ncbi:LCP family protein [Streptomyces sp. NPDC091292]|uniref:LCP family protein n=1 Tax=Streptomyces sp. NPDC091292 TaxID=3365991 RepID=UPI0037FAA900
MDVPFSRDPVPAEVFPPVPHPPRSPGSPRPTRSAPSGTRQRPVPAAVERRRRRPRWVMRMATAFSVVVLASAGIGHVLVTGIGAEIDRVDPFKDMKNRPQAGHGMNVLLVGTDGRDKITEEERRKYRLGGAPCHCTDTIMIVHISGNRERASVVSLPRDSYAEIPEHTDQTTNTRHSAHPVKLNAAYAEGGPQLTVRTVEHMTGVKVDHYLEVDFTSFMKTVDVLGGVEICTARPMKDAYTGLDLAAGTHDLNGGEALQYVRSRHIDGAADLGRMERQQRFLAALIAKATSSGILLNPVRFSEVSQAVLGSVRADKEFGADEMLALGRAMRGFSPKSSEFTTVPIGDPAFPVKVIGSTVKWDEEKSKKLFQALREDRPLTVKRTKKRRAARVEVAPQQIQVQVENGGGAPGLGKRVDDALRGTGFRTTGAPRDAQTGEVPHTVVVYDPRWDRSAQSLATALPGSELRPAPGQGPVMRVIAGQDFTEVRKVRAAAVRQGEFGAVTGDEVVCP